MSKVTKVLLAGASCAVFILATQAVPRRSEKVTEGRQWLAWTAAERQMYILGFIDGYYTGSREACDLADQLFEVGQPHRLLENPTARCQAQLEQYTKIQDTDSQVDLRAYTSVITDFYSKHPEYQSIPKVYLLSFLTDRRFKTSDQLYQMASKGEMRTRF